MAYCPLCGEKFKDRRGLHGHFRFKHGIEYGSATPAMQSVLTEAIRDSIEKSKSSKTESDKKLDTIEMALMFIVSELEKVRNDLAFLKDMISLKK